MPSHRALVSFTLAIAGALSGLAYGEIQTTGSSIALAGKPGSMLPGKGRGFLGLNPNRTRSVVPCGPTVLGCEVGDNSLNLYSVPLVGNFWGVELGYMDISRATRGGGLGRTQGLNFSLVGKAPIASSLGVFGKLGTTYGHNENLAASSMALASADRGFGLSFGAGLSYEVTPQLSATLAWDSHELRFGGSGRESVRATSLGMQYRY